MKKFRFIGQLMGELFEFAKKEKVYWIVPLVAMLLLLSILMVASQGAAPFIYTLF